MKINSATFIKGIRGTDAITQDGVPAIAFVGRSNVGKSSIINALCNKNELVKVSRKPGKTTEINFFLISNKFYFVDLPGYGYAKVSPREKESIQKLIIWYLTSPEVTPQKVVLILDAKVGLTLFDKQMIEILQEQKHPYVLVANKIDKLTQKETAKQLAAITAGAGGAEVVPCSATTPRGIEPLRKRLW
ncbi:MAG TPA: ribosome biogenesis GTP-binding protein YihA/YsxC [Candidatus Paceibacterota bacterium]